MLLSLVVFGPALFFKPFIFDDYTYVFNNARILQSKLEHYLFFLTKSLTPLPFITWKLIALIDGDSPFFFRLFNIFTHAFNGTMVFLIARHLFKEVNWAAWVCAILFLFHPTQVEAVVWVSSLKTLMATAFALAFTYLCLKVKSTTSQDDKELQAFLPAALCYFAALLCNPTVAPVIILPLLLSKVTGQKFSRSYIGIIFGATLITAAVLLGHKSDVLTTYFDDLAPLLRIKLVFVSMSTYLLNLLFPFNLTFDYQINPLALNYLDEMGEITIRLMLGPLTFMTSLACLLRAKTKTLGVFLLALFVLLLPHMGLVLHDFNNISVVSDRYLNLSLLAFSLTVTYALIHFVAQANRVFEKIPPFILPLVLLMTMSALTVVQVSRWNQPKKLMKSSQNLLELRDSVLVALGNQFLTEENFQQARFSFKQALAANPESMAALLSLMNLNEKSPLVGEDDFIVNHLSNHNLAYDVEAYIFMTRLYLRVKDYQKAKNLIETLKVKRLSKLQRGQVNNLSETLEKRKVKFALESHKLLETFYANDLNFERALYHVLEVLKLEPDSPQYRKKKANYQQELKDFK